MPTGDSLLFADVPGQDRAIAALWAAVARPVHAYLLVGPPGSGKAAAARSFAAALLCPQGGDGSCESCRRVLSGVHPDLVEIERDGPYITVDAARAVTVLAARSPVEGDRKVLVLADFHLVREAGPALLKTIEEPPPSTVFVVLAEYVPPELVTIASRCVQIDFPPLAAGAVVAALVAEGIPSKRAADLAAIANGRLDRARMLASDAEFDRRRRAWQGVPQRLDGRGHTAAAVAGELIGLLDSSSEPLLAAHQAETAALEARYARAAEINGKVSRAGRGTLKAGVRELDERHKRAVRRQRTDELRAGLAVLAGAYRDRLASATRPADQRHSVASVALVVKAGADLDHNPGELLALQALLARLGRVGS